jgi:hypothetical protein
MGAVGLRFSLPGLTPYASARGPKYGDKNGGFVGVCQRVFCALYGVCGQLSSFDILSGGGFSDFQVIKLSNSGSRRAGDVARCLCVGQGFRRARCRDMKAKMKDRGQGGCEGADAGLCVSAEQWHYSGSFFQEAENHGGEAAILTANEREVVRNPKAQGQRMGS